MAAGKSVPKVIEGRKKALCHPRREHYQDGMCRKCFALEERPKGTAGMPVADIKKYNELVELHRSVEYVDKLAKTAHAILNENLVEYARLHLEAARIAAADGDSKPSEWALTHVKAGKGQKPVAEPPAKAPSGGEGGVNVYIGLKLGEMPPQNLVVEAERNETPE